MDERQSQRLSAYLDGELPPSDALALEAALSGDAELRRTLDELSAVRARARSLDPPPVPADLWAGIESRMRESPRDDARPRVLPFAGRRFTMSLPQLLAAAAVLVLVSATAVWTLRGRVDERTLASRVAPTDSTPVVEAASFDAARIEGEIAALQTALDRGRARLDPQTVQILEKNLALIRQATADAKQALAADPANADLQRYFAGTVASKLEMMKRATQLAGV